MANTSRNPNEVLNDADLKGYSRILFQQGKPVCDFELTLLGDLANPQRIADRYIGNGVPIGPDDGFAIDNLDIAAGDFTIRAGRCLVNGHEVLLRTDTRYKTQPHQEQVRPFPKNKPINVYLRVFPREITDREDEALQNKGDVGTVTTLREKTDWEVLATDATINLRDHFLLATFNTKQQSDNVSGTLVDRRRKGLTMAKLRDEFDALGGTASNLNDRLNVSLTPEGALKSNVVGNTQLANNAVTADKIADGSVTNKELSANAVTNLQLANNAVTTDKIADGSVTSKKLAPDFVPKLQLADNAVTTNAILNESVTDKKLAANAVNETALAPNAVSKRTIQDGAISMTKLAPKPILESEISVPRATTALSAAIDGKPSKEIILPGETVVGLQIADEHAFFLISVRLISPRPLFEILPQGSELPQNGVSWMQRSVGSSLKAQPNQPQSFHQHQLIIQNFNTKLGFTVACKAFRIAEA